ncbi:uncharacterized protein LOC132716418 [Ruditapes philippinarum]|uniref:uncharacterized protein LOC132716418 n=1 Tax=Ruditapes philippinarum TaxID=129788 RepID=UPI00295ADBEE|nr:uncharacterized protein LOC132716418 [Ruditapes philippinarum]XP_060555674.1 uncharacterized protein LOC132716418 [Ruditapes philippinarum]
MSSADDADDERESAAPTPVQDWVDPKCLKFTIFIVLPNDEVCTMRDLLSGITVDQLKCRLELHSGVPAQIYTLVYPDGGELAEELRLVVRETILDGYLLKMRIHDNWESLYITVSRNCIEQVYHSGGVHLKGNIVISETDCDRYESTVRERGTIALFIASFLGLQRMANMLLSVGVHVNSTTLFGRTPLHAAVAKDHVVMAEFLISKGASIQKADCYGIVPIDLAKQMSSSLCFRKLRLMQLNFRGSSGSANAIKKSKLIVKIDTNTESTKQDTYHPDRTQSKLSQYSDGSSLPVGQDTAQHISRKHLSSSAPVSVHTRRGLTSRERTRSSLSNFTTGKLPQNRRNVKWKDTKTEYTYCKHLHSHQNGLSAVEETVKVKPMRLAHPKTMIKYSNIANQEALKAKALNGEENPNEDKTNDKPAEDDKKLTHVMKYSKERLNYFKKLATPRDDYVPMKDRKKFTSSQNDAEVSVAFKNWLKKKTAEIEAAEDTSSSGEYFNQSESEDDRMYEFNKRVRKKNRDAVRFARSITPGNRPLLDVMEFGSTQYGDGRNPPADLNIGAYKEWRTKKRGYLIDMPKTKRANDVLLEKRRLEEKRQKLLLTAISYDEWMDHAEERKMLIKQILKADKDEMRKLEEDKLKYRQRKFSYDTWKEKMSKRDQEDKKRKDFQKKYEAERMREKLQNGTTTVPFDDWLKKKRLAMSKEQNVENNSKDKSAAVVRFDESVRQQSDAVEQEARLNNWMLRKNENEGVDDAYIIGEKS